MSDDSIVDIADAIIVIGPSPSKKMLGALLSTILLSSIVLGFAMNTNPDVDNGASGEGAEQDQWRAFSVVAPIDTGINVYHEHFRNNETLPAWLGQQLGVTITCNLTFEGSYQEMVDADRESCWDLIGSDDVVYFAGTRIFGQSPDWTEGDGTPILDDPDDGHGSAVTGAVVNANPNVIIFFVEGFSTEAVLAAANQPLVDVITTSFGAPGSLPVPGIELGTKEAVVSQMKLHAGAADNSPSPAVQDATAGPPWSIGIAGYAEEGDDQKEIMSGSYPDISADWTQVLPNHQDIDGYHETSGTSFATPRTAGIISFVLEELRDQFSDDGSGASPSNRSGNLVNGTDAEGNPVQIKNSDVREAINLSAWYPDLDWDPTSGTMPISPIAPCTQTGWGLMNLSNIEPIIKHLNGSQEMPSRASDIVLCMQINQQAREAYWGAYPSIQNLMVTPRTTAGDEGATTRD
ncbi:MAG: S8/S53 family peptidase [Candidatus Poseidoniales archaeon]